MTRLVSALLGSAVAAFSIGALALTVAPAEAQQKVAKAQAGQPVAGKPLRGVIRWKGGYSYSYSDVMGLDMTSTYRFIDPGATRQTTSGPFDSGFFFDSGIGPRGGESPYQN